MSQADHQTYIEYARMAALRSRATRLKVGAVLVDPNRIMVMGYNGTPSGWDNCCEDENDVTKPEVIHAELNAIFKFVQAGISTIGSTLYLTHSPCMACSQIIHLSGISSVVYLIPYRCDAGLEFLRKAGIEVIQYEELYREA